MVHALLPELVDVLAHDNGVIDHDAQHHQEGKHRDHVDAHTNSRQEENATDKRDGHTHHHPEGKPDLEKHGQDQQHDTDGHEAVFQQQGQSLLVIPGAVAANSPLHTGRQRCFDICHGRFHAFGDLKRRLIANPVNVDFH